MLTSGVNGANEINVDLFLSRVNVKTSLFVSLKVMGAKGGKHAFYHEERGEKEERPLPGRKHLTRKLTDKKNNKNAASFHVRADTGYQYTAAESPEIKEVKLDGIQTPYWKIKWPKRSISFHQESDGGEAQKEYKVEFKNLKSQEEKTEIIDKDDYNNASDDDDGEMMTQRTILSDVGEQSQGALVGETGEGATATTQGCINESFQKEESENEIYDNEESCEAEDDESASRIDTGAGAICDDRAGSSNSEGEEYGKIDRKKSLSEVEG